MTAHPSQNPHPERGPLWVRDDGVPSLRRMMLMVDDRPFGQINTLLVDDVAAQLGQDLPGGFTLAPVATGAALIAVDPHGLEWQRFVDGEWCGRHHRDAAPTYLYPVRRIAKPAKVRVKVGDAHRRTIDGKRITDVGYNDSFPGGWFRQAGITVHVEDADGMVEVDALDGDR